MLRNHIVLLSVMLVQFSWAQLPNNVRKLEGTWKYKSSENYEVWVLKEERLVGAAYRKNKIGDTSLVEKISIARINKVLFYNLETFNNNGDSIVVLSRRFIGGKRKMKFLNVDSNSPYMIAYSFGFLNRDKLKIKIQYGILDKPMKLTLGRIKE